MKQYYLENCKSLEIASAVKFSESFYYNGGQFNCLSALVMSTDNICKQFGHNVRPYLDLS